MAVGRTNAGGGAKLTGDAAPADVISGKTFYNNDPKTKLTGTLVPQELREQSGTFTSSTSTGTTISVPNFSSCHTVCMWRTDNNTVLGILVKIDGVWKTHAAQPVPLSATGTGFTFGPTGGALPMAWRAYVYY